MKKSSLITYILLTIIASVFWLAGSWWHYTCNIKNACANPNKIVATQDNINQPNNNNASIIDTDDDGLSDAEEAILGTDPLLTDTDQDSISDSQEVGVNLDAPLDSDEDNLIDALDTDDDNDGLSTFIEERIGSSSLHADTDEDSILDVIEVGEDVKAPLDTDGDGIINALDTDDDDDNIDTFQEALLGTNHLLKDSDGDGISDTKEIGETQDAPLDVNKNGVFDALETDKSLVQDLDQDNDGLSDLVEAKLNTNPTKSDSDDDGIDDAIEVGDNVIQPLDKDLDGIIDALDTVDDSDSDNDGLTDAQEIKLKSNPQLADSDNDGINDLEELGKNPDQPLDTDNDGLLNLIDQDDDNDSLGTSYETRIGTNPLMPDSDNDGLLDNIEAKAPNSDVLQDTDLDKLINPVDSDDDNDTIPTFDELALGTDPLKKDSDDDGITDDIEVGPDFQAALDSDKDGIIDALDTVANNIDPISEAKDVVSSSNIDTQKDDSKSVSLELTGAENKDSIQSSILYFPFLSSDPVIAEDSANHLDKVAAWLKQNPKNKINLIGHTDNIGSRQSNLALGIKRVMIIRKLLINRDSPITQIEIMSRGESQPITSNTTENGRLKNRRVEIVPFK